MTLVSLPLTAVLNKPSVATTAMVITASTTAYSAIVWPVSARRLLIRRGVITSPSSLIAAVTSAKCFA